MSVHLTGSTLHRGRPSTPAATRRSRRDERRRLTRRDRVAAQLAELHFIRTVLEAAAAMVGSSWVQHEWFTVAGTHSGQRMVTAYDMHAVNGASVSGACLVGAIVHAAGGPGAANSQLTQRTLDLTWHALHQGEDQPVRWCPAPAIRTAHVRDLTRWNDHRGRTAPEVTALLRSAVRVAAANTELLQASVR